ncbi:MAG: xanthine dehydrogenase family protein molybdopterin-binding subunit, partial [Treponema sp.]|nr:xanthine dehydrogenase family protein molybdopterin-binding subunit [Treponema sp.]
MEEKVFLEDIYPQNFLYAKTIRSPVAKGHLKFIQFPKMPEEYIFITARDIPGINTLSDTSMPILAEGDLSYIGEPIALLLGEDKTKLNEFASMCNVICDEGKPVFSCLETTENEPAVKRELLIGETKEAFQRQGKIVTGTYITGIQDHWYAEPAGAITWFKTEQEKKDVKTKKSNPAFEKTLVVKTATQWSHHVKRSVAQTLGLDPSDISVEPTSLSLHMDGKLWYPSFLACHAALGTFITGRPVRLILNREEDFLYSPKRFSTNVDVSSVVDEEGNISATEIDIFVNLGAHEVNGREILDQACLGALGFYDLGDTKISARADKTNIPPQGPFSGFGMSQGFFSLERHVSMIADLTGQDPAVWRINHLRPILSSAGKNQVFAAELINTAAKMGDYHRKWASYELLRQSNKGKQLEKGENPRGIGIALGFQGNGLLYTGEDKGAYSVEVTLTKESKLEIKTSISSAEDYVKIWEKVASQVMSLEPDMIRIITENAPDSG